MATTPKSGEGAGGTASGSDSHPVSKDHNLHVVWGVTLMAVLGTSSVTPAFPRIVQELGISPGQVVLLITFFTLPGVFLTPVAGMLSDRFGRKTILVPSLLLFGIAGGACALARDFELLLGLRALQGMGAAALGATNVTLIGGSSPAANEPRPSGTTHPSLASARRATRQSAAPWRPLPGTTPSPCPLSLSP